MIGCLSYQIYPWPKRMTSEIGPTKQCYLYPDHSLEPYEVNIILNSSDTNFDRKSNHDGCDRCCLVIQELFYMYKLDVRNIQFGQ